MSDLYREYRLHSTARDGTKKLTVFREWFNPQTNRQRRETALALKYKAKLERMNAAQRRKLARKVKQSFRKYPPKARNAFNRGKSN
jgi:hypothetical protein